MFNSPIATQVFSKFFNEADYLQRFSDANIMWHTISNWLACQLVTNCKPLDFRVRKTLYMTYPQLLVLLLVDVSSNYLVYLFITAGCDVLNISKLCRLVVQPFSELCISVIFFLVNMLLFMFVIFIFADRGG